MDKDNSVVADWFLEARAVKRRKKPNKPQRGKDKQQSQKYYKKNKSKIKKQQKKYRRLVSTVDIFGVK